MSAAVPDDLLTLFELAASMLQIMRAAQGNCRECREMPGTSGRMTAARAARLTTGVLLAACIAALRGSPGHEDSVYTYCAFRRRWPSVPESLLNFVVQPGDLHANAGLQS